MDTTENHEREMRAARNQALFRTLNENIKEVNLEFSVVTEAFVIACECTDETCVETLDISTDEYAETRSDPWHFVVLEGHVDPEAEKVIAVNTTHVVVEKRARARALAEAARGPGSSGGDFAERRRIELVAP
jgi:hypothetical protein